MSRLSLCTLMHSLSRIHYSTYSSSRQPTTFRVFNSSSILHSSTAALLCTFFKTLSDFNGLKLEAFWPMRGLALSPIRHLPTYLGPST